MKVPITRFALVCLLLLTVTTQAAMAQAAQEKTSSQKESTSEIELLRKKVQEQDAQINQLQQSLHHQSELLERQQQLLQSLVEKVSHDHQPQLVNAALEKPAAVPDTQLAAANRPADVPPAPATPVVKKSEEGNGRPKQAESIETGFGKIKFDGLLQGWFAGGDANFPDTFRVRRAEMYFIGDINSRARWTIMIDPSKALSMNNSFTTVGGTPMVSDTGINQASRILQDAFITLTASPNLKLNVGQFKVPLGLEGGQSSAALDTVERALFLSDRARGGNYGDIRDIGVMAHGPLGSNVNYQIGMFNGSGENQNDLDRNDQKAVAGRLVVRPSFVKGLQIGGSGAWGHGTAANRPRRDRLETELMYVNHNFKFKSEFVTGKDADMHRLGYYTHVSYKVLPKLETVFRYDVWDPDTHYEVNPLNVTERDFVTGFNYYISENNVKLQMNYLRKTYHAHVLPSRNLFLVNLQTFW